LPIDIQGTGDGQVLRITSSNESGRPTTLKIEGSLTGDWVDELSRAVSGTVDTASGIVLDMAGVTFVDQSGVSLLRRLKDRGIDLVNGSDFVETLVNGDVE
jgi:anti-anti-sigma regulatory factor